MNVENELKRLEEEYNEYIKTEDGKKWKSKWQSHDDSSISGDFGDYLYDFYPEYLA